ncbi:hypothetical protein DCAR_0101066 [Daucus carota subsp. sativus]|uniref:Uncharacterized protein n=1 Tax=Daucus carota subsp. sativus TaxID=79200 RepID=A0A175YCY9_DAUCS|nr:hypothetical protein DCAR_0101066 [Daucus carota subsp. sativus]
MEFTGLVADKFCILLTYEDTLSNELKVPRQFCSKYSDSLHDEMELKLRNGYIQHVELDFVNCHMKGVLCFFKIFELKGGDLIMFEYFGHCKFNVYIIGTDCSEIRYPDIVNYLPGIVTLGDDGWRFVTACAGVDAIIDEIEPPPGFIERCGFALPERIIFVLSNGKSFVGRCNSETSRLSGLSSMFKTLVIEFLDAIRNLLFTALDSDDNEIVFPGTPLSIAMESSGLIEPKFIRFLTNAEINSDELKLPKDIVKKYCDRLKTCFFLKFRNGYEIPEQLNEEKRISMRSGGFKFVTFVKEDNPLSDDFEAPASFKRAIPLVPGYQNFLFSNGKKIEGGYNRESGKFYSLRKFCQILVLSVLIWKKRDYINAYAGDRAWKLQVRTRRNQFVRCGILDGWIKFREDLGLAVGDVVVLKCTNDSLHHFSVKVIKNADA